MEIAVADEIEAQVDDFGATGIRAGKIPHKWLFLAEGADGLRFRLCRSEYLGGEDTFESPRHHHSFQQIRWTESGSVNYAPNHDIPAGSIAYFPRGTFYGPQRKDRGCTWLLQFGFGSELPPLPFAIKKPNGLSRGPDRGAMGAGSLKTEVKIPDEGYQAPILMHPAAFEYYDANAGVRVKHLGSFYGHAGPNADTRISVVRLEEGGSHTLSADRAQLGWSAVDGLQIHGRSFPRLTSFYSPLGEVAVLAGKDGAEVFVVDFPRLDQGR